MSVRRLGSAIAAMAVVALLLASLTPGLPVTVAALAHPQRTVDTEGADVLLLAVAGTAAWVVWAWGALGLALTAAAGAPGAPGAAAQALLRVLLPAGARRGAALALGIGLGVAAPVLLGPPAGSGHPILATAGMPTAVPSSGDGTAVPDWPAEPASAHVVVRGDCLWDIAAGRLAAAGAPPTDARIATAVDAWWAANAEVVGPDPDLILPGQVLRPPSQP